ncbi:MAG: YraN family protein [Dehalococcoidia bacterium]|nr:YraN family protein [Dehalococcoidia bacterium]
MGARGEETAVAYLRQQGYGIVQRNYRCPEGEMDIVAREGDALVFVEVRTLQSGGLGTPEASVTPAKGRRLIAVAQRFLQEHPESPQEWRIDLIALRPSGGSGFHIEHLRNAVEAG